MEFFETNTQFILKEEGIENTKDYPDYKIRFSRDMNCHYKTELPQFELTCKTGGGWGWSSYFKLCYRGFDFTPKYKGDNKNFILNLLNDLKRGDYQIELCSLIENSIEKEKFDLIKGMLKSPNTKAEILVNEIEDLRSEIDSFEKEIESIRKENQELRSKLDKVKEVLNK